MEKSEKNPEGVFLFLFLLFFMFSVEAFYTKELLLTWHGEISLYTNGNKAIVWGLIFSVLGVFCFYQYFRLIFYKAVFYLKNIELINITYIFWILFISIPIIDYHCGDIRFFKFSIMLVTGILSYLYHRRVAGTK